MTLFGEREKKKITCWKNIINTWLLQEPDIEKLCSYSFEIQILDQVDDRWNAKCEILHWHWFWMIEGSLRKYFDSTNQVHYWSIFTIKWIIDYHWWICSPSIIQRRHNEICIILFIIEHKTKQKWHKNLHSDFIYGTIFNSFVVNIQMKLEY